jgi:hypothetical protein
MKDMTIDHLGLDKVTISWAEVGCHYPLSSLTTWKVLADVRTAIFRKYIMGDNSYDKII